METLIVASLVFALLQQPLPQCSWDLSYSSTADEARPTGWTEDVALRRQLTALRNALLEAPKRERFLGGLGGPIKSRSRFLLEVIAPRRKQTIAIFVTHAEAGAFAYTLKAGRISRRVLREDSLARLERILAGGEVDGYIDARIDDASLALVSYDVGERCGQFAYLGLLLTGKADGSETGGDKDCTRGLDLVHSLLSIAQDE